MLKFFKYLNDPHLVRRIQQYFGVVDNNTKNEQRTKTSLLDTRQLNGNVCDSEVQTDEFLTSESEQETKNFIITNRFWYFLFLFGTELGDEIFYATFIPFWFWNIDGAVGRRIVMVWTVVMYFGQGLKDIVCWPRPASPPVFRLQKKWSQEYGMPSTHAMVGISIPFSIILFTAYRYQYNIPLGITFAILWGAIVSISRLYLGMHTVLDIIVGIALAILLMIPMVPIVDVLDIYILTNRWAPIILLILSISVIVFYPKSSNIWTPTRSDTTMIVSVCAGVLIGAWANFQLGQMREADSRPPYAVIWPNYEMIGLSVLRTSIGYCCIIATRAVCKSACYATLCFLLRINPEELQRMVHTTQSSAKNTVELTYKYITYVLIGFNIVYLLPAVFKLLHIERPTFYTEI